jgi:hypothetical protein
LGIAFEPVMPRLSSFLDYALRKFNESSLIKAALYCVSAIVTAIQQEFYKYSDGIIPLIMEILTNTEVSRYNKTTAITVLGEISIQITEHFLKYFEPVMELLLSACELAMENAEYDDEDTEEYLKELRFDLVETFTFLSFMLDDCREKTKFVPYVQRIFNFFRTIIGDNYQQKPVYKFNIGDFKINIKFYL